MEGDFEVRNQFDTEVNICIISLLMTDTVRVPSPAKINLHLEVYPRREDGFHNLLSVFQAVSLFDEVEVRSLKSKDECVIEGSFNFPPEENIIYRSWQVFRQETGFTGGVAFRVKKRIPLGAGLGGGSSNAAAALRALNILSRCKLSPEELAQMGAQVGSDVPFFCRDVAALVSGRGEELKSLPSRRDYSLLLLVPPIHISTGAAYKWLDEVGGLAPGEENRRLAVEEDFLRRLPGEWGFFNSFFPVLAKREPILAECREKLTGLGADFASLSGSGSAVFGVFSDSGQASRAETILAKDWEVNRVFPLDGMPKAVVQ